MLKKAMKEIPEKGKDKGRFEIPKAIIQEDGAKTIIVNFNEIASTLRREPAHLLKVLLKELATKGEIKEKGLVVIGRFSRDMINKKLELYVKKYVICPACGKPDTKISKKDRKDFLICEACGASHPLI